MYTSKYEVFSLGEKVRVEVISFSSFGLPALFHLLKRMCLTFALIHEETDLTEHFLRCFVLFCGEQSSADLSPPPCPPSELSFQIRPQSSGPAQFCSAEATFSVLTPSWVPPPMGDAPPGGRMTVRAPPLCRLVPLLPS